MVALHICNSFGSIVYIMFMSVVPLDITLERWAQE
jgi:hypothetical protein